MKMVKFKRLLWMASFFFSSMFCASVYAEQCTATYVDGLTNSSSSGKIKFQDSAALLSNGDTILATTSVTNSGNSMTCESNNCSASGNIVPKLLGVFQESTSNDNFSIDRMAVTIDSAEKKNVEAKSNGILNMDSNILLYKFDKLTIKDNAIVNMTPGDYYIRELEVKSTSQLKVIGNGTVRLYVKSKANFKDSVTINGGAAGDASKLLIYFFAQGENYLSIKSTAQVSGFIYSDNDVELKDSSAVFGGISAEGEIRMISTAKVTFRSAAVSTTDFGSSCTSEPIEVDHYQISHDGSGSTCEIESITLKACADSGCSTLVSRTISLDFQANSTTKNMQSFVGSKSFTFSHTDVETLTLSIANPSITPNNPLICSDGVGSSCEINFTAANCPTPGACASSFSDGLTNSDVSGKIKFEGAAKLNSNVDSVLATSKVENNGSATTCISANCSAGGSSSVVTPLSGIFLDSISNSNLEIDNGIQTIATSEYKDIEVKDGGTLNMDANILSYKFKKLYIKDDSTVNMTPGDYYIEELTMEDNARLNISSTNTVRIYVKKTAEFYNTVKVNGGSSGNAARLLLYYVGDGGSEVIIKDSVEFTGFIYSKKNVSIEDSAKVYGGISAQDEIKLKDNANVYYRGSSVTNVNFGIIQCTAAGSGQCSATFADAATNSDVNGLIRFKDSTLVVNNPDTVLETILIDSNSSATTCTTAKCTASGAIVPAMAGVFIEHSSSSDISVNGTVETITTNDYDKVVVKSGGTLTMSSGFSSYTFKELTVTDNSTLNMTAGDYYIERIDIRSTSIVNVIGAGTVRIYISESASFKDSVVINGGSTGDASKLFLYYFVTGGTGVDIRSTATFTGFIYSKGNISLRDSVRVYGAVSAAGAIELKSTASITYKGGAIANADFGASCSSLPPTANVDHYRFEYDGSALTCATESVVVKACANSDCSQLVTSPTDLTFTASIPEPSTASQALTFTGSTVVTVAESTPTTVTMSLSNASPTGALQCYQNGVLDDSCNYSLSDTGFIVLNETDNNQIIPTQIAGKPSDIGYNAKNIVIQAVQTDTLTGACTPLFADGVDVDLQLAYQCENPSSCITTANNGNDLSVTNNGNEFYLAKYASYSTHSIRFDADSKAIIAIKSPDVGLMKLHTKFPVTLLSGKVKVMTGNSNSFVVRPFGLYMDIPNNPAALNNTGGAFIGAGQPFAVTVNAVQWQAADDLDNNGVPDSNSVLSNNAVTLNFGQEAVKENVVITAALVSPMGGNAPALINNQFDQFFNGAQTRGDLSWSEVGILSFSAALTDGNYLNTDNVTAFQSHVGRFIPDHFRLTAAEISQGCGSFSYMGQDSNIQMALAAQGVDNIALQNYDSTVGIGTDNHALGSLSFVMENDDNGVDLSNRLSVNQPAWTAGTINSFLTPLTANFARLDSAPWVDGPFDAAQLGLVVLHGEANRTIGLFDLNGDGLNMDPRSDVDCNSNSSCTALSIGAPMVYRYGRLFSAQVFGPATESLTFPLSTQFWNGTNYELSVLDNCSTIAAANITLSDVTTTPFAATYDVKSLVDNTIVGSSTVDVSTVNSQDTLLSAVGGNFSLVLTAPSFTDSNSTGYIPISINTLPYPWLQFDWTGLKNGSVDASLPTRNLTFGQFRGNDRVISWREKH